MSKVGRVVLGLQNNGLIGVRASSRGNDAFSAADDGQAITFDSTWTDIARIGTVGICGWAAGAFVVTGGTIAIDGFTASYANLGYKPFAEVRILTGTTVRDDFFNASFPSGGGITIEA